MSALWFCYDPDGGCGLDFFNTEAEAKAAAEALLERERDAAASYGWEEYVTQICWGIVVAGVEETSRKPATPEQLESNPDFTEMVEYNLVRYRKPKKEKSK